MNSKLSSQTTNLRSYSCRKCKQVSSQHLAWWLQLCALAPPLHPYRKQNEETLPSKQLAPTAHLSVISVGALEVIDPAAEKGLRVSLSTEAVEAEKCSRLTCPRAPVHKPVYLCLLQMKAVCMTVVCRSCQRTTTSQKQERPGPHPRAIPLACLVSQIDVH